MNIFLAENIAEKYGFSRESQDIYALNSQKKTAEAQKNGIFVKEITPIEIISRRSTVTFSEDEYPKHDTTLESLSALRPVFKSVSPKKKLFFYLHVFKCYIVCIQNGVITAGNASGINDGAAVVLLMNGEECKKHDCTPMAKIVSHAECGVDPKIMGTGPIPAILKTVSVKQYQLLFYF